MAFVVTSDRLCAGRVIILYPPTKKWRETKYMYPVFGVTSQSLFTSKRKRKKKNTCKIKYGAPFVGVSINISECNPVLFSFFCFKSEHDKKMFSLAGNINNAEMVVRLLEAACWWCRLSLKWSRVALSGLCHIPPWCSRLVLRTARKML